MVGAIALVHWKFGLFMNWFGKQPGEGFEYHLLVIAICIALIIRAPAQYRWTARSREAGRDDKGWPPRVHAPLF